MARDLIPPAQDLDTLARWGTEHLTRVVAIDSQSDETSDSIPSTEGQRRLSDDLRRFFEDLGYKAEQDRSANLIVTIPANLPEGTSAPRLALMVHMDTSEGTRAVPSLEVIEGWDGARIAYPENERLNVSVDAYPATRYFVGEDVLHGPGDAPFGLDDKLGMSELMTLARVLAENPRIPHGELLLVFRPDEEIGRMEAVESLADALKERGVTHGYTIDGITPFEINVANFNASGARVLVRGRTLPEGEGGERLIVRLTGVKSHGATAHAEGYLNATVVFARAMKNLEARKDIAAIAFESDPAAETTARIAFRLSGPEAEAALLAAIDFQLVRHVERGARCEVIGREAPGRADDGPMRVARLIDGFLAMEGPEPVLSEDSHGDQGYSNPHFVSRTPEGAWQVLFRLRDFDPTNLAAREDHVRRAASAAGIPMKDVIITRQYINMGPALARYPELTEWATRALGPLGQEPVRDPIRGGTGVDPFLQRGIPIANLGTGYFAPESEKELTSRQNIARHASWLVNLVQVVVN